MWKENDGGGDPPSLYRVKKHLSVLFLLHVAVSVPSNSVRGVLQGWQAQLQNESIVEPNAGMKNRK